MGNWYDDPEMCRGYEEWRDEMDRETIAAAAKGFKGMADSRPVSEGQLMEFSPNAPTAPTDAPTSPFKGKTPDEATREAGYQTQQTKEQAVAKDDSAEQSRFDTYSRTVRKDHDRGRDKGHER